MKVGIIGCAGRMGQELLKHGLVEQQRGRVKLVGGTVIKGSSFVDQDICEILGGPQTEIKVTDDTVALIKEADALIDFTSPENSIHSASIAAEHNKIFVCGTTGFSEEQLQQLEKLSHKTKIAWSPNMSLGVNIVAMLTEKVASFLDNQFDIEIVEMHHRNKVDAPSGTALLFGEMAAKGRKVALKEVESRARDGYTGVRKDGDIGFAVLRGGDVIGDHTVMFAGEGERIELTHKSSSRAIYARGAFNLAQWLVQQKPGKVYNVQDMFKL